MELAVMVLKGAKGAVTAEASSDWFKLDSTADDMDEVTHGFELFLKYSLVLHDRCLLVVANKH